VMESIHVVIDDEEVVASSKGVGEIQSILEELPTSTDMIKPSS
jgi:hypothetical protein